MASLDTEQQWFSISSPEYSQSPIKLHALVDRESPSSSSSSTYPTIINLHYWGGSASSYHHLPPLLQSHLQLPSPVTVVSLSHRGWGLSQPAQPDTASAYSITAMASDVVAILPELVSRGLVSPERGFVLCGHSMGAKVAMAVLTNLGHAMTDSNKIIPPLRGLVLLAPAPPGPMILSSEEREPRAAAYETRTSVEWTIREVLAADQGKRLHPGPHSPPAADDDFELVIRDSLAGSTGARKGWLEFGMPENIDLTPLHAYHNNNNNRDLKIRILVSRTDRVESADRVEKEVVEVLRPMMVRDVTFRVIEPEECVCGHLLPLEAPAIVTEELVRLLNDVGA